MHANEILLRYRAEIAELDHVKALLFSVNNTAAETSLYEAVRYAWRLNKSKAEGADIIFATRRGIIVGVFVAEEWLEATTANFPGREPVPGRWGFAGGEAAEDIKQQFIRKRLPDKYRSQGARYTWEHETD